MSDCDGACLQRRDVFRLAAGGLVAGTLASEARTHAAPPAAADPNVYPEKVVGRLSQLEEGKPLAFTYPLENHPNQLFKLGAEALRGVGLQKDVVAFSALCTHMGGNLSGRYRHDLKALGPCPFHFSTFDLRKGGMPVHASATQNLPQVLLRLDGDEIVAYGMVGLIYGQRQNLADAPRAAGTTPGRPAGVRIMRA
jgi:arsenite oxidase small subunit